MISDKLIEALMWPAVATVLGVTALVMFRAQIRQFLGRTQSVGKGWLVATPTQQSLVTSPKDEVRAFLDSFSGELLRIQEQSIRDDLSKRQMQAHPDLELVLVRSLAITQIALACEQIHAVIWDGQIQLLETLNAISEGIERHVIEEIYDMEFRAKRLFYADIPFGTYVAWLAEKNLIRSNGDKLALTVLGREFLKWMVENGKQKRGVG